MKKNFIRITIDAAQFVGPKEARVEELWSLVAKANLALSPEASVQDVGEGAIHIQVINLSREEKFSLIEKINGNNGAVLKVLGEIANVDVIGHMYFIEERADEIKLEWDCSPRNWKNNFRKFLRDGSLGIKESEGGEVCFIVDTKDQRAEMISILQEEGLTRKVVSKDYWSKG